MTRRLPTLTRRGLLAAGGAAVVGVVGGCAAPASSDSTTAPAETAPPNQPSPAAKDEPAAGAIAFYGEHQAGVETPPALLQTFVGLDLLDPTPANADAVLRLISDDAARLTQGRAALGDTEPELAAHTDGLTVTVGLGRPLFERTGRRERIPAQLVPMPSFATDAFEEDWSQTHLLVQVGSNDPLTLAHTIRMLTKDLSTLTRVRWTQTGFGSPVPAVEGSPAGRNLMGQVDGIVNPVPGTSDFADVVWIDDGPTGVVGGTVLVLRRIRLLMDTWNSLDRLTQETVMGRQTANGAPIGGTSVTDPIDFDATDANGLPVISPDAHVRVSHATTPQERILRRPYSYDHGVHGGTNDMGLLFAAYMRDPSTSFIPIQRRIARSDAFNRWNTTIGSSVYFLPPGAREGGFVGEGLFT